MSVWYQIFSESLTTHSKLGPEDIDWAAKLLASSNIELPKKTMFAMMMNRRTFSGLHSRMFNATIDDIIINRSVSRLSDLVTRSFINIYPELYDNSSLTKKDREMVKGIANDEYNATIMAVNSWNVDRTNILPHIKSKLPAGTVNTKKTSYTETYGIICYQNDNKYPKPVNNIRTKDPISGVMFCFNKNEIAVRFSQGDYSNPMTGQPLPRQVVEFVKKHLDLEIKLFGRPMDIAIETPIPESDLIPRNTPSIIRPMMSPTYSEEGSSLPTLKNGRFLTPSEIPNGGRSIKFNKAISTPRVDIETGFESKQEPENKTEQETVIDIQDDVNKDEASPSTPVNDNYFISSPIASKETDFRDKPNEESPIEEPPSISGINGESSYAMLTPNYQPIMNDKTPPGSIPGQYESEPPVISVDKQESPKLSTPPTSPMKPASPIKPTSPMKSPTLNKDLTSTTLVNKPVQSSFLGLTSAPSMFNSGNSNLTSAPSSFLGLTSAPTSKPIQSSSSSLTSASSMFNSSSSSLTSAPSMFSSSSFGLASAPSSKPVQTSFFGLTSAPSMFNK